MRSLSEQGDAREYRLDHLALTVGLSPGFRLLRAVCAPALVVVLALAGFLDSAASILLVIVGLFLLERVIESVPLIISTLRSPDTVVLEVDGNVLKLYLEETEELALEGLEKIDFGVSTWGIGKSKITAKYPDSEKVIRTNLVHTPLFKHLKRLPERVQQKRGV